MADLVIRGMEMPTKCADCYLVVLGWCCCLQKYVAYDSKPLNCPLVPLPEGHGRLGDGDALREDWLENGENEHVYDTNAMLYSIDNSPTIVPAEGGTDDDGNAS